MRAWMAALLVALAASGGALAEGWTHWARAEGGTNDAAACLPGEGGGQVFTSLCVSVGCRIAEPPTFGFALQEVALPPETRVRVEVDGVPVAEVPVTVEDHGTGGSVPLWGQEVLLEALRTGAVARIGIQAVEGWRTYELPLAGSQEAIDAALVPCAVRPDVSSAGALPADTLLADTVPRSSADPVAEAERETVAFCGAGAARVEPELVRRLDLDADGDEDLVLDWAGLVCDGSRPFCGSGGCTMEVWLAEPGRYRLALSGLFEAVDAPAPGALRVVLDGAACGRTGAEECTRLFAVRHGRLLPKG